MTTKHYVLIEGHSGFVWEETDATDPIEACRLIDQRIGGEAEHYEIAPRHDWINGSGYFVYETPADWKPVENGQDPEEIERVEALNCVAKVTYRKHRDDY
jgi:hypothetical protein